MNMRRPPYASFKRPVFSPRSPDPLNPQHIKSDISCLSDLIRYNARENPHHIFAIQTRAKDVDFEAYDSTQITFLQLDHMVRSSISWFRKAVNLNKGIEEQRPIALYVESDVELFIHLAALLTMRIPALLISARLAAPSVLHLLEKTNAQAILLSKRTRSSLEKHVPPSVQIVSTENFSIEQCSEGEIDETKLESPTKDRENNDLPNAVILHSSGTTGLPKPIFLAQRYILGYAACHEFPQGQDIDWVNFSTLPLYHGFGLLAPCLSLTVGMTCCFPPSSIVPATKSTLDLIRGFDCRSLMTVPSIVDDILCLSDDNERSEALRLLRRLKFLAVGGGALKPEHGVTLAKHLIKLLNHYGATEIGAIAPIFCPGPDYDSRNLRLRSDLGLELHSIPNSTHFRLVGYPIGWNKRFEVQDELERIETTRMEVRILGRTDDVIVLKTGEKVQPRTIEQALNADSEIRNAVCVGSGFFQLAVIIESVNENVNVEAATDHVWELLSRINPSVDSHARITSRSAVIIKTPGKVIPRSDKGSIMRGAVHDLFKDEIRAAYDAMELDALGDDFVFDSASMEAGIRYIITAVASNRLDGKNMSSDEDFFEAGMDSLQAVLFARLLNSAVRTWRGENQGSVAPISAEFIYRNPSIGRLENACLRLLDPHSSSDTALQDDRASKMRKFAQDFIARTTVLEPLSRREHIILMTGSTGGLGSHTLARLTRMGSVAKVICLVRSRQPASGGLTNGSMAKSLLNRQRGAFETAGICLEPEHWAKIELLDLASFTDPNETGEVLRSNLARWVTHILHLAWPMDFQRTLEGLESQVKLVQTLVELAQEAFLQRALTEPIRLLFSSSIAVVRYFAERNGGKTLVPETLMQDPLVSVPMGYAEAKWVCEYYLNQMAMGAGMVEPAIVRIGQLTGPEKTSGMWNTVEHMPKLVRSSQLVEAFPDLQGDASWIPVDRAADSLCEILFRKGKLNTFLHLENPIRQPLRDIFITMAHELQLPRPYLMPFQQWLQRATAVGEMGSLEGFFKEHFEQLAGGAVTLGTTKAREISPSLAGSSGLEKALIVEYIERWRRDGFLR